MDSHQGDWAEIQRWVALAGIALDRWSNPVERREVEDRLKAA
jgi:hypothetical protein